MINASARCVRFMAGGGNYPGFESFSGNYDTISQSGLVIFNATVEIAFHPDNPQSIDTRENLSTWSWCKEVTLMVANDAGNFIAPRCIPKLFIKSAKYDPVNDKLRLELTDILGIKEPLTVDDFKTDFDDDNAIEDDEPERLGRCTFPDDEEEEEEVEESTNQEWWEQWEFDGFANNIEIIKEILSRLRLSSTGTVSGQVKCPYSISGSLIGVCGELAFKSFTPSYLWSDWKGIIHIERMKIDLPPRYSLNSQNGVLSFESVGVGNFISELIVTGRESELVDVDEIVSGENEQIITRDDGTTRFETRTTIEAPNMSGAVSLGTETITGEWVSSGYTLQGIQKFATTHTKKRKDLIFPNSVTGDMGSMYPAEIHSEIQWFDVCTGILLRKQNYLWECWGTVFSGFYSNFSGEIAPHIMFNSSASTSNIQGGANSVPGFPMSNGGGSNSMSNTTGPSSNKGIIASSETQLTLSKYDDTQYFYNESTGKVRKIQTVTREPAMKILSSYFPPVDGITITGITTETWTTWGQNHHAHIKNEARPAEEVLGSQIQNRERQRRENIDKQNERLLKTIRDNPEMYLTQAGDTVQTVFERIKQSYMVKYSGFELLNTTYSDDGQLTNYTDSFKEVEIEKRFVLASQRLALINITTTSHSRGGEDNAPNPEYLPRPQPPQQETSSRRKTDRTKQEWKFKSVVWRVKWDGKSNWGCTPPREIFNVGDVISKNILGRIGEVVFALRQAQAQTYQTAIPITNDWLTNSGFKPCARFDITECHNKSFAYFGNGYGFEFTRTEAIMMVELWFLGRGRTTTFNPPTISSVAVNFIPSVEQGVFYLGGGSGGSGGSPGQAVFVGQSLTPSQLESLIFVPGASFSGMTGLSYVPTTSTGQTSTIPIPIAVVDPSVSLSSLPTNNQISINSSGVSVPIAGVNTGEIGVVVGDEVQYVTPSITFTISQTSPGVYPPSIETPPVQTLEANGFGELVESSGFIDFAIQPQTILQRTYTERQSRLSFDKETRLTQLYR